MRLLLDLRGHTMLQHLISGGNLLDYGFFVNGYVTLLTYIITGFIIGDFIEKKIKRK